MKLWELIEKESKDKTQTWGILNNGSCGYCIDGLIIKAIEPDMNIEHCILSPIDDFIKKHKDKFDFTDYVNKYQSTEQMVQDLKDHYKEAGKLNMNIMLAINDTSMKNDKPFTFADFTQLFKEMDVEI